MNSVSVPDALLAESVNRSPTPENKLRVVYLAGSGHTGSTLLAILMQAHPRVISVGNTAVNPKIRRRGKAAVQKCSCGAALAQCAFWQRVFQRVNEQGFEFGASQWSNDYRLEHRLLGRLLSSHSSYRGIRRLQYWAADHLPIYKRRVQHIGRVNVAFVRAVLDVGDADVFFDTSKRTVRLTRLLMLPELDVKVVRLVRDVRGYAASAKRRGQPIVGASHAWKHHQDVISEILHELPRERQMLLRYEDLCTGLEGTMLRLYAFAGVENIPPVTQLSAGEHHVIGNSMRLKETIRVQLDESWRSRLTAEEQREVMAIAGQMNRGFGYV
jgi:hypothetical protein